MHPDKAFKRMPQGIVQLFCFKMIVSLVPEWLINRQVFNTQVQPNHFMDQKYLLDGIMLPQLCPQHCKVIAWTLYKC